MEAELENVEAVFVENGYTKKEVSTSSNTRERTTNRQQRRGTDDSRGSANAEHPTIYQQIQQDSQTTQISSCEQNRQQSERPYIEGKDTTWEEQYQCHIQHSM